MAGTTTATRLRAFRECRRVLEYNNRGWRPMKSVVAQLATLEIGVMTRSIIQDPARTIHVP